MTTKAVQRFQNSNFIQTLPDGTVLLDYGPMRMTINLSEHGVSLPALAEEGARLAMGLLEDLSPYLPVIRQRSQTLKIEQVYPEIVRKMIEATRYIGEPDLTPLAAVAGTFSEMVANFLFSKGGTKVIVENGGDIALRLQEGEAARIGVKSEIDAKQPACLISVDSSMGIEGVATSGLGGRSFTKGIASAVTVLSKKASLADAAATVIGNYTNVDDSNINRTLAERIYPDTDIAGEWVTVKVGELSRQKVETALNQGLSMANSIQQKGLIHGALIAVQGRIDWTESLNSCLTKL